MYGKNGTPISSQSLRRIIRNPKYKGYYRTGTVKVVDYKLHKAQRMPKEEWQVFECKENIPQIVSEELWEKCNNLLEKKSQSCLNKVENKEVFKNRYTFSGLIFCKEHQDEEYMPGFNRISGAKRSNKPAWACSKYITHGLKECESPIIQETELIEIFKTILNKFLQNKEEIIEDLLNKYKKFNQVKDIKNDIENLENKIKESENKKDKLLELAIKNLVTDEEFYERNEALNKEIKRYNEQMLPEVNVIDMNQEFKKANGYFSNLLISKIQEKIDCGDQVILFLNKRGYTSLTSCKNCGFVEKCPYCDISLTYHKSSNMLRCHYCGYATKREKYCRDCHEEYQEFGLGTEKVEEEIEKLISGAKVIRMDVDTTSRKSSHEKIVNAFASGEYNILLGTQMIAKGLDFPNVTLVGVINADISLNFPDFRSSEVTFQLLNQVAGRSGRGDRKGEVLIQTFNPDHYAIRYAKSHDYMGFYREEMAIRRKLKYPPFYYICQLRIISKDYKIASDNSITIANFLKKYISNEIILGPSVSNIFKLNNKYRFQIIIKYKDVQHILPVLKKVSEHYFNKKDVKVEIDFNPLKL